MESKLEDPGHVIAQRYLDERGFKYWDFMQDMAGSVRVISHRQCLENCGFTGANLANYENIYYLWFDYPGTSYGSGRCLNPTRRMSKMLCPKDVTPPIYLHPNLEPQEDVYFCESVLKAIKMVDNGFCALAGNGVNGINTNKGLADNFPDALMEQAKRAVILFDSDIETNKNVKLAAQKLALALTVRWPHLQIIDKQLPPPPGIAGFAEDHWGLDDYCSHYGDAQFKEWVSGSSGEHFFDLGQRGVHLLELAAQYAVCKSPVGIVCFLTGNIHSAADFRGTLEANRKFYYQDPDSGNARKACGATEYVEWRSRNEVDECRYIPGGEPGFSGELYNKWRDDGATPVEGEIETFKEFLTNAIPRAEDCQLMLQMLAYSLQNRGWRWAKLLVLISVQQSTGKSTLAKVIRQLYGPSNAVSVDPDSFGRDFNGLFMEREVVVLDDAGKIVPKDYHKIQRLVTDDQVDVNVKFGGQYMAPNYINIVVTSNSPDLISLRGNERRLFALEVTPQDYHPQGDPYWADLYAWLDNGGVGKVRWWLEHMDLSDFEPNFMPPLNPIKVQMLEAGRTDMDNWVLDLRDSPAECLGCTRLYYKPEELFARYILVIGGEGLSESHKNGLKNKLTQALNRVGGFKKCNGGDAITFSRPKKHKARFWNICGNANANAAEVRADFEKDPLYIAKMCSVNDELGVQGTGLLENPVPR